MATDKLLAEWFWTDRWMGSSAFLLPLEARGLYREMLTQAWRRGAQLPNDHEAIRRAVGATVGEWRRAWPKVKRFWRISGDVLVNDTQLTVFADAKGRSDRAQARAQAGAQAKHKHQRSKVQVGAQDVPSVSDLRSPSPAVEEPPNPLSAKGGRVTRADRKQAKEIRARRFGRCHHDPSCANGTVCEARIAQELADRRLAS